MNDQPEWIYPNMVCEDARAIVSVGVGSHHYRRLLRSTENHCAVHCQDTMRRFYDVLPAGCPAHFERPYRFKIAALQEAISAGFRYVLWMDATFQPIASIEPLWQQIKEQGWYCSRQGEARLGSWTTDAALRKFGISRDAAMKIDLVFSGLVGFDIRSPQGRAIFEAWRMWDEQGAFEGPHINKPGASWTSVGSKWSGHCSDDPRCEGHRQDESALSFVLHQYGLRAPAADWEALGIGRNVPDYDIVKMREELLGCAPHFDDTENFLEEIRNLCR